MRILLTEDDHPPLANTMLSMLRDDQNTVDWVDDGQQALNALLNESFDLAILDLTLPPRVDGLDIVRQVREQGVELPIIILTARSELTEKLQGLDAGGADDYLTKPFAMSELKARIRAVTRRRSGTRVSGLKVGGRLVLDPDSAQLQVGTETFVLPPRSELQILHYLMRHPDQVATRRRLEEQLYGWDQVREQRPGSSRSPSAPAAG